MSFAQFLSIVRSRWKVAMATVAVIVLLVWGVSFYLLPEKYVATASIVVDVKSPDPLSGGFTSPALAMPSYMATQIDVIESKRVAMRVAQVLKLDQNLAMHEAWQEDTQGRGSFQDWLSAWLKRGLDVKPSRESNVIEVSYRHADPRMAATLANAFCRAYLDTSLELRVSPAKEYSRFFDDRLKQAQLELEQAQSKLTVFQRSTGIINADERLDVETGRLNELSGQLVLLRSQSAEANGRASQSRSRPDEMPEVLGHPVVAGLKSEISRQEAALQQVSAKLGENHPDVVQLKASIASLRAKFQSEVRNVVASVDVNRSISNLREVEVKAAYEAQRQKVIKTKVQRDEMAVLQGAVMAAQRAYDALQSRLTQSSLESQTTQTNVTVLTYADEPYEPTFPKPLLNTVLAFVLGSLLALGVVLTRELMDRRVRIAEDVTGAVDWPVLGVLPREERVAGLLRLVRRDKRPGSDLVRLSGPEAARG